MELQLNKETVYINEVLYDGQTEQGVEFDYVLPDYYPDIFKVLKCTLTPRVASHSVSGSQLFLEGAAYIRVMYLAADSKKVYCVDQRYTFSKTIDLGKNADGAVVTVTPKTDYVNCRAVSGRRIDVRGAVSIKVKVTAEKSADIITGANGDGIETQNDTVSYGGEKLNAQEIIIIRDDIDLGTSKDGSAYLIGAEANVTASEHKVIADKVIVKAEVTVKAIYAINKDNENDLALHTMEAVIPVNKIIDLKGVTEKHTVFVNLSVLDIDLAPKPVSDGENRVFTCDLSLDCKVSAAVDTEVSLVTDLYSTMFDTDFLTWNVKAQSLPKLVTEQLILKSSLEGTEDNIAEITDAKIETSNLVFRARGDGELTATGQAVFTAIGKYADGTPAMLERTEPFEAVIPVLGIGEEYSVEGGVQVSHVTYNITGENRVDVRATLVLRAAVYNIVNLTTVKDITVNTEKPKTKDTNYALKLYYAEDGESIWDIAKRYNTGAAAIISENDLSGGIVTDPTMLLIPIN
ncbi:MAG: DUF3794 domain-containing protein [Oscillospiraceae bacterium]|jgi:LysM repeat protein|nr:DUF3794 domain-containing protein [Oscillospiraceae bacterium]